MLSYPTDACERRHLPLTRLLCIACTCYLNLVLACPLWAQPSPSKEPVLSFFSAGHSADERVAELELAVAELQRQVDGLRAGQETTSQPLSTAWGQAASVADTGPTSQATHYVTFDKGWVLRPHRPASTPFELKFNIHNQFRYTAFLNTVEQFVDSAGVVSPVPARNDFDINRGRWVFSGYAFDPKLEFYTNIDYNTVASEPVLLLLSWMSYDLHEACKLYMGLGKVPSTWEWEESSRFTHGAERSMATTFFRPSITAGVWVEGEPLEGVHYRAMMGDGFNTFTLRASQLDQNLLFSGLVWWEPWGDFGRGFSDVENHDQWVVRAGQGFTFSANDADPLGEPGPEQTLIRLSDGTRLVEKGALTPGVSVNEFDISLYTVHLGLKRRGFSLRAEFLMRWLTSLRAAGPLPTDSILDYGFVASSGAFIIPQRLELYATGSQVDGAYGNGTEVGGGINWYVGGERGNRFTCEAVKIDDSPAQQGRTGLVAGGSGTLLRAQWWHFF